MTVRYFFKTAVLLLAALMLAGCWHMPPQERVVYVTDYVLVKPEEQYLQTTPVPAAPTPRVYVGDQKPDFEQLYKEQALLVIDLYKAIGMCNADKHSAREDILKKSKQYD